MLAEEREAPMAPISMGSPSGVPVPCTAMQEISLGLKLDAAREDTMRACCDGPLGAVNDDDLPSWLIAEPCIFHVIYILLQSDY